MGTWRNLGKVNRKGVRKHTLPVYKRKLRKLFPDSKESWRKYFGSVIFVGTGYGAISNSI